VLGGSGFIGSHLCDLLSSKGHKVNIFDIKKSQYKKKNQKMYIGSILDKKKLSLAVRGCDFVYHFAALADLDIASNEPLKTAKINIIGTINALEICKKYNIKRFIFASSIYANAEEGSFYGSSKQAAESYIEKFYNNFGLNYTILRFGSLYGNRSGRGNGIKVLINSGIKKGKLIYGGSKRAARKYIHVEDAANSCVEVIQKKYQNKYLTITGKRTVKVKNLINILAKRLKISRNKIKYLNNKNAGHYDIKPTPFKPRIGKNIKINKEKDFKNSLMDLIS
jgi:UDP-glucose 4-epimerase